MRADITHRMRERLWTNERRDLKWIKFEKKYWTHRRRIYIFKCRKCFDRKEASLQHEAHTVNVRWEQNECEANSHRPHETHERFGLGFVEQLFDAQRQWREQKSMEAAAAAPMYGDIQYGLLGRTNAHRTKWNEHSSSTLKWSRSERTTGKAQWNKTDKRNRNPSDGVCTSLSLYIYMYI